jgi:hypothetical protein
MRPLVASPGWTREEDELLQALIFGNECCGDLEAVEAEPSCGLRPR